MKNFFKLKYLKRIVVAFVLLICFIFISDKITSKNAEELTFDSIDKIPKNKIGLLLGTGKFLKNGYANLYYQNRIDAALKLYNSGKIEVLLISGDNSRKDYDEPTMMKEDLVALGIPEDKIYLDYAGFRTLDSVVRAKKVFGVKKMTIISQKFHNERAIYLSESNGVEAIGFNAKGVSKKYGKLTLVREKIARSKMLLDLLLCVSPKFLGPKISIN